MSAPELDHLLAESGQRGLGGLGIAAVHAGRRY